METGTKTTGIVNPETKEQNKCQNKSLKAKREQMSHDTL